MMKLESAKAEDKLLKHVGVASWFNSLRSAQPDFVANERIVWVDIEGVPLHAWPHATFHKIGSIWGEVMEIEEGNDDSFAQKRLCIKTCQSDNILESIKIIVTRKVFKVRVKELFVWSSSFKDTPMGEFCSDDEFVKGNDENNVEASITNNAEHESDIEAVSDTYFGDNLDEHEHEKGQDHPAKDNDKETSPDPFNIYDLLDKHEKEVTKTDTGSSLPYPPGFTPDKVTCSQVEQKVNDASPLRSHSKSTDCNSRIFEDVEKSSECFSSGGKMNGISHKEGGSILSILEETIKVGQAINADHTRLISKSIFITNFPEVTSSKDLWNLCQSYGTVVDVFIPYHTSKAGKRFTFVRFSKVNNVDRLVENLCTLWIGRMHLQANVARFERPPIQSSHLPQQSKRAAPVAISFASAVKGIQPTYVQPFSVPALVLDDSCLVTRDLEYFVMGELKIIVKGKVFRIRAKELFVWSPFFKEIPEMVYYPDDESVKEDVDNKVEDGSLNKVEDESDTDTDVVFDTYFGDNTAEQDCVNEVDQLTKDKEVSHDPLNIYDLLNKGNKDTGNSGVKSSILYPPGFTPDKVVHAQEDQDARGEDVMQSNSRSDDCNSQVFEEMKKPEVCLSSYGRDSRALRKKGGSILDVIDEMIKVGQIMGFTMEGCTLDMEKIIGSQGVHDVLQ
nr:RNA-directed DNA polymerase, eukaryota [Tanacetum cinerariifolium]